MTRNGFEIGSGWLAVSTRFFYRALKSVKPLRAVVRCLRRIRGSLRPDAWILEGVERTSGERLRVLYVGQIENCNYIARVLFREDSVEQRVGRIWSWRVDALLNEKSPAYGMIFVQQPPGQNTGRPSRSCFVMPSWLAGELDVTAALSSHHISGSVKRDLRHVRRNGFTYRVTTRPSDLERFFTDMYLPYVRQTHGDRAFVSTREQLEREAGGRLELLLIERHGKPVAGACFGIHDGEMHALELGVVGADRDLVRMGALAAIYYYSLIYAAERKCSRLNLGGARPFLHDGALQYKKKWGLRIIGRLPGLPDVLVFRPRLDIDAVKSFLLNNPFAYEDHGTFRAAAFFDGSRSPLGESIQEIQEMYCLPGLAGITAFDVGTSAKIAEREVMPLTLTEVAAK